MIQNTVTSLADGQLPAVQGTIYTSPTGIGTAIKTVKLCNTSAVTTESVKLWVRRAGSASRRIINITLSPGWSAEVSDMFLSPGDILEGNSTNANTTDYTVSGMQQEFI
jgi:hypothetical protein